MFGDKRGMMKGGTCDMVGQPVKYITRKLQFVLAFAEGPPLEGASLEIQFKPSTPSSNSNLTLFARLWQLNGLLVSLIWSRLCLGGKD